MSNTSIDAKYLIDPRFTSITKQIVKKDQVIDVYLHNLSGPTVVSGGLFGSQIIDALAWSDSDINFAHSFIDDLDSRLGIDFAVTTEKLESDINIYLDKSIDIGSDGKTLGLAITNFSEDSGYFWEIFLDRDGFSDERYFRYGVIHEIAHTLGMEHPFSDDDGDLFSASNDPWQSTYPEDTVMSYRSPRSGVWPNTPTNNDWNALESQWGRSLGWVATSSAPSQAIVNVYARELVNDVLTGSPQINQNSFDVKFYNLGEGRYGVQQKGKTAVQEITEATFIRFSDKEVFITDDVKAVFDQVKGVDDVSGVVFRLYNAAFARLPDAQGLENWIDGNSTGGMTYAASAEEFASSQEFQNRYGSNSSDTKFIGTLYNNVLGRSPDSAGFAHYQDLLAGGKERGALLLDFSESPENRVLFTQVTGLS